MGHDHDGDHPPDIEIDVDILPGGELIIGQPKYHSRDSSLEKSIESGLDKLQEVDEEEEERWREQERRRAEMRREAERRKEEERKREEERLREEERRKEEERLKEEERIKEEERLAKERANQGVAHEDDDDEREEREEREKRANEMKQMQERLMAKMKHKSKYAEKSKPESPSAARKDLQQKDGETAKKDAGEGQKGKGHDSSAKTASPKVSRADLLKYDDKYTLEVDMQGIPAIEPPRTKKSKMYTTPEVFKEFDEVAIKVSTWQCTGCVLSPS